MPPDSFWEQIPTWAAPTIVFVVVAIYILARASEAYEGIAKLVPIFGKYWHNKAADKDRQIQERASKLALDIAAKIKPPDYEALSVQVTHLTALVEAMEITQGINQAYLVEDAKWHLLVDVAAAEAKEWTLHLPPRLAYSEFSRKWREEGWRPAA